MLVFFHCEEMLENNSSIKSTMTTYYSDENLAEFSDESCTNVNYDEWNEITVANEYTYSPTLIFANTYSKMIESKSIIGIKCRAMVNIFQKKIVQMIKRKPSKKVKEAHSNKGNNNNTANFFHQMMTESRKLVRQHTDSKNYYMKMSNKKNWKRWRRESKIKVKGQLTSHTNRSETFKSSSNITR